MAELEHVTPEELALLRQAQVNLNNLRSSLKRAEAVWNSACAVVWGAHGMVPADTVELDDGSIHRAPTQAPADPQPPP